VVTLAISGVLIGLYGPLRNSMITGATPGGPGEVLKLAASDLLSKIAVMLLLALAIIVGFFLCIIPAFVAAFFLAMAPYLVAAAGVSVGDSIKRSFELSTKNAGPILIVMAAVIVVGLIVFGIAAIGGGVMVGVIGPAGLLIAQPVAALLGLAVSWFTFLLWGSTAVTIETAHNGIPIPQQ
jgi:hypothetical protein